MIFKYLLPLQLLFLVYSISFAQVSISTQHNNLSRTGENTQEIILNTSNVNVKTFGKVFARDVDDQIYAQPLVISGVDIPGKGKRNVVYVATVNNSVYAFDADDPAETNYFWRTNFLSTGVVPPKNTDMTGACSGNYVDFSGNMGIVGTPVIDTLSGVLYVVARTKEGSNYVQKLHALSITDGKEMPKSPVVITATYPGTSGTNTFDAQKQNQRPGLLLLNGIVYIGFASHCDWGPYHGWFLGYDATTLEQKIIYNTTPNGSYGGIWMSGQAPSADAQGNIYLVTGNGTIGDKGDPRAVVNRGESSLKLTPNGSGLTVASWFTPNNYQYLEDYDIDLGSSGPLLIPNTKLAVFGGKEGFFYVVNRDTMGGLNTANNNGQIVQHFAISSGNHFHGSTIYYYGPQNEFIYMWLENDYLKSYKFDRTTGKFGTTPFGQSLIKAPNGMPGAVLSSSSWGQKANTGIIWAAHPLTGDANHETRPGIVRAFDANDVTKELWNSEQNSPRDKMGSLAKFNCPTIANGKLYMGTFSNQLVVYGLTTSQGFYRTPENPAQPIPGLSYSYYETNAVHVPDFTTLTAISTGIIPTFDISASIAKDTFAYEFTGYLSVPVDAYYTFYTSSDDGSNLYIGNTQVVNNDGTHPATEKSGTIGLKAGLHAIRVVFFENTGGQSLTVSYESPDILKTAIPASVLFHTNVTTGVDNPSSADEIVIYPNPSEKEYTVLFGNAFQEPVEITVYNALGTKVLSKSLANVYTNSSANIDMAPFPMGIYTIVITNFRKEVVRKIVKK